MDDTVICKRCGKGTTRYAPNCLHCGAALSETDPSPAPPSGPGPQAPDPGAGPVHVDTSAVLQYKKCPYCAEKIHYEAIKCKFCGEILKKREKKGLKIAVFIISGILFAGVLAFGLSVVLRGVRYDTVLKTFAISLPSPENSVDREAARSKTEYIKNYIGLTGIGTMEEVNPKAVAPSKYAYGTVKNNGNRTIDKVKVAVYYINKSGKRIGEDSGWSVFKTLKGKPDTLKPGDAKEFQLLIVNTDPEWFGKIEARVVDIEFLE